MNRIARVALLWLSCLLAIPLAAQITETHTFNGLDKIIPDGTAVGAADFQTVSSAIGSIATVKVRVRILGEFNGDLYAYVVHQSGFAVLLNRPGKTGANPAGYADSGLDVTFAESASNGDVHTYQGVAIPAAGLPLTGQWQPDGRDEDPAVVTETTSRSATLSAFTGMDASGEWTLFVADLESGGTHELAEWELEFAGVAQPQISWDNPADITYGTALDGTQLNATTGVAGTFAYTPSAGTVLEAGAGQVLSVTFTPDDAASYSVAMAEVSLNVLQKTLTIAAEDKAKVYGAPLPTFTVSYAGFVNGDNAGDLTAPVDLTTAANASSLAGDYAITPSGALSANYHIGFVEGTLSILPADTVGTLSSVANPSLPGQPATFTFVATAVAPGSGTPTGLVQFNIDGAPVGAPVPLANGSVDLSTSTLTVGLHAVTANYAGDANFSGSTAGLMPDQLVNTPPEASPDFIQRPAASGTKVLISQLLANDSDADGDPVVFLGVNPVSAEGATVVISGDWVFYTPAGGSSDSFTYSISDGRGDPVIGTVTVSVQTEPAEPENLAIDDLGNGSYRIRFAGIPHRIYTIQYAESLEAPAWQDLHTDSADALGRYEYVDSPPLGSPERYYRSVTP